MRRWNVLLDEARRGNLRLTVDFEMRPQLPSPSGKVAGGEGNLLPSPSGRGAGGEGYILPLLKANAVAYQSGMVAIEGDLELEVDVKTAARRVNVGQLGKYAPLSLEPNQRQSGEGGKPSPMRFLGTYDFVGETPKVAVNVVRNPSYALTPAIVQQARLTTLLSADGTSQTQAQFQLRTKASYLEVELPDKAALWSAVLDGAPLKPQKQGGVRLLGLPPSASDATRSLQLVYEAPVRSVTSGGRLSLAAPRLLYRANRAAKQSSEIPLVNFVWTVTLPSGYEAVATDGTLEAQAILRPLPAPLAVAGGLFELGDGFQSREAARRSAAKNNLREIGMAAAAREGASPAAKPSASGAIPFFVSPTRRKAVSYQDSAIALRATGRTERVNMTRARRNRRREGSSRWATCAEA